MAAYSFLDTFCTLTGPNGVIPLGSGSGVAEEGITVEMAGDKNTQTVGADGEVMNSLHAANNGMITVRLLKTSPFNALLSAMYIEQRQSSLIWGRNVIVVSNITRGDVITATSCAFKKFPTVVYAKEGPMNEWIMDAGKITQILGPGL